MLAPRGLLIDARPDSRVLAYAERVSGPGRYSVAGHVRTSRDELRNDRASDDAIAKAKRERLFRSIRRGRFWHRVHFDDLDVVEEYIREHVRFEHRIRWKVDAAVRHAWRGDRWVIRHAVRFELLRRLERSSRH